MSFVDVLVQKNILKKEDKKNLEKSESLEQDLIELGVSPEQILSAKAEYYDMPKREVDVSKIPDSVLAKVPEDSAAHYRFVPLGEEDGVLLLGITDPENIEARDALSFITSKTNQPYKIFLISEEDFDEVLDRYKGLEEEVEEALSEMEAEISKKTGTATGDSEEKIEVLDESKTAEIDEETSRIVEDAPVTKIVATIFRYAIEGKASDVHIEIVDAGVRVRFRVDGVLNTSLRLPKKVHSAVVARIKILSNMRLDEKRKPQDGRFSAKIEDRKVDFRVSTFPTYYGEKVVVRILDQEKGVRKLDELGLSKHNLDLIKEAIKAPYGIILISGPTGSGKTTTLYSILNELDSEKKNILSLEDPVEYNIDGVSQSQVRPDIGYTFANGLRTTLRQDPDIIMVGEIRDKETAQLAIQAALTGHLVFSTIHTNNAIGVITRLVDMGVDPYLIAPTLRLAVAQRLVKKLCPGSGKPIPFEGGLKEIAEKTFADLPEKYRSKIQFPDNVYEPSATDDCASGIRGRLSVMEVVKITKEMERQILRDPKETELYNIAREQGMLTIKEDAFLKAFNKEIPFEEVNTL